MIITKYQVIANPVLEDEAICSKFLHRQFRKVTKNRVFFPSDGALNKMIYLVYRDISKKWIMPIIDWAFIFPI